MNNQVLNRMVAQFKVDYWNLEVIVVKIGTLVIIGTAYINLFHVILFLLHFPISADDQSGCELQVTKVGCFADNVEDKKFRSYRTLLANMRDQIDWDDYAGTLEK